MKLFGAIVLLLFAVANEAAGVSRQRGSTVVYVDQAAEGANDGTSWGDAWIDLQDALANVEQGSQVWVATGTYRPGANRAATFQLIDGVEVYGGFAGAENPATFDLDDRDFKTNKTILDGNIGGSETAENVFHVVTASGTGASAVLDGCTITGGFADGIDAFRQSVGGGMLNVHGNPTIRNCLFKDNKAASGGGLYNDGGSPTLINCTFIQNRSTACQPSNPTINRGGAVYSLDVSGNGAFPTFINCVFIGNRAGVGCGGFGGGLYDDVESHATLVNCTLSGNVADTDGGGVRGIVTVINSILWGNSDRGGQDQSAQLFAPTNSANVSYSCIQGGWPGVGNIGDDPILHDPQFVDPAGDDEMPGTEDDNLRLVSGSPCVDAGNNETMISDYAIDNDRNPRFANDPDTPDTGSPLGADAIVDMGAFEFRIPCTSDSECDDGDLCTEDHCDSAFGQCVSERIVCDDGLFCNGVELCVEGQCQPGSLPDCDDGVACTLDSCALATDSCQSLPDDSSCDNGEYCDGEETCHSSLGCQAGTPVDCDDGVDCTIDSCDESGNSCQNIPDDALCDDGVYCNSIEACDSDNGCQPGTAPCLPPLECDEALDTCVMCLIDLDCDDADACTTDVCTENVCHNDQIPDCCITVSDCADLPCTQVTCVDQSCVYEALSDGSPCVDELFCNGAEACAGGVCTGGPSPCVESEICDEENDRCEPEPQCQDDADCDDANPCTDDTCQEGSCGHVPNAASCDDGYNCTSNDVCSDGTCTGTSIPGCGVDPPPSDDDSDDDGVTNDLDSCPRTATGERVDADGCSCTQLDSDGDGVSDCDDRCPEDEHKAAPGACGCGSPDTDEDEDGMPDCFDVCAGEDDTADTDGDGVPDCFDLCPLDGDSDADGLDDCLDVCPNDPNKTTAGFCGCGVEDLDVDGDRVVDCHDLCPATEAGVDVDPVGCSASAADDETVSDGDDDGDGVFNTDDLCAGTAPGLEVDEIGCPVESGAEQPIPSADGGASCGVCGAFGVISWSFLVVGLLGMKASVTRKQQTCSRLRTAGSAN